MSDYIERVAAIVYARILVQAAYNRETPIRDDEITKAMNAIPAADVAPAQFLAGPVPKLSNTNYGSLVTKTPEEMAIWLGATGGMCPPGSYSCLHVFDDVGCSDCWLEWLKKEES